MVRLAEVEIRSGLRLRARSLSAGLSWAGFTLPASARHTAPSRRQQNRRSSRWAVLPTLHFGHYHTALAKSSCKFKLRRVAGSALQFGYRPIPRPPPESLCQEGSFTGSIILTFNDDFRNIREGNAFRRNSSRMPYRLENKINLRDFLPPILQF